MRESVFSKIYSYRERENKNCKENFFTEIFAHCLSIDKNLLNDFLKLLNIETTGEVEIKTQTIYEFGRPDIEINIPSKDICILIECKIEHFERLNQLQDYSKILELKKAKNKHLVYLTKYYDFRESENKKVNLHLVKWFDIFQIIEIENDSITKEFKKLIKDESMSESKNFNYTDLTVMKSISGTIRKMDEVLDGLKTYYEEKIGVLSKDSARSTRLTEERYCNWQVFQNAGDYRFDVEFGFNWWFEEIYITTRVCIHTQEKYKNTAKYNNIFKRTLKEWNFEEIKNFIIYENCSPIAQFIIDEDEQIPAMVNFLKSNVDKLLTIKKIEPEIFN
ncbi:PD-(D/E)XK nuclease family protein [Flavobacterium psychrophilum]|uniref:PD-(D/E)XK nuclease family protein n=1 Tax=Flavobacterium psychrophilum TaxID=96345 RepID=UPI000B7C5722|nr:PD-(D/E)XK nuclease family protein [Flavobacterium psychrophilum]MCB6089681.1 PD-(D/E)XK nuclease family protein [Flavobacterium psychrophilum]SNA75273.1 hypothetical protein DK095_430005 [Flavobacterium psychrophilum]